MSAGDRTPIELDPEFTCELPGGGRVLFTLASVDRNQLVRKPRLFKEKRDLRWVGGGMEIEADHIDLAF